jgi:hypothetical protein
MLCPTSGRRWVQQMCPAIRCCRGVCVRQHLAAAALEQGRPWPWRRPAAATPTSAAGCLVAHPGYMPSLACWSMKLM